MSSTVFLFCVVLGTEPSRGGGCGVYLGFRWPHSGGGVWHFVFWHFVLYVDT